MAYPADTPAHDALADEHDEDGWNVDVHGRMLDYADEPEPDTEVA